MPVIVVVEGVAYPAPNELIVDLFVAQSLDVCPLRHQLKVWCSLGHLDPDRRL